MRITLEHLKIISKNQKESVLVNFVEPLNELFQQFEINTLIRQSFYLSNVLHESGEFKWLKELSSGEQYNNRKDLDNGPNDGPIFKGRGLLQSTGRANYQKLSDFFKVNFIKNPELLESPKWSTLSSGYFWKSNKLNSYCDQNDFLQTSFRVNGGFNGLKDRLKYLKLCFKTFQVQNSEITLNDIFQKIEQNIKLPQTNYYKKSLLKAVPDLKTLNELKLFIKNL